MYFFFNFEKMCVIEENICLLVLIFGNLQQFKFCIEHVEHMDNISKAVYCISKIFILDKA